MKDDSRHPTRWVEVWFALIPAVFFLGRVATWAIDWRARRRWRADLPRFRGSRDHASTCPHWSSQGIQD